jgi:uncharacterized protein
LRDGCAVLAMPGGLRWAAQQIAAAYNPPRQFADELTSLPLRAVLPWQHVHEFAAGAEGSCTGSDRVSKCLGSDAA